MDSPTSLELALAATRPGVTRGLAGRVHREGLSALYTAFEELSPEQKRLLSEEAGTLAERGIGALLRGDSKYPRILDLLKDAPAVLFYSGQLDLLSRPAIGVCGSRNVSEDGLKAASTCGELAASYSIVSVSGYARGVDTATHAASLRAGGDTIIVLPEGLNHFRIKRGMICDVWNESRALLISQFAPTQPWTTGGAMTRNSVIIGLSTALVVVEAGERGGTLAAGTRALDLNRRVLALEFAETPIGNRILLDRGAIAVTSRSELATFLDDLRHVVDEETAYASQAESPQQAFYLRPAGPARR